MVIVIQSPTIHNILCFGQAQKQFAIEAFISEFAVKRFYVSVFPRAARLDKQRPYAGSLQPSSDRLRGELWAVIATDMFRPASNRKQLLENLHNIFALEFPGNFYSQTFTCKFINNAEHPEPPAFLRAV